MHTFIHAHTHIYTPLISSNANLHIPFTATYPVLVLPAWLLLQTKVTAGLGEATYGALRAFRLDLSPEQVLLPEP